MDKHVNKFIKTNGQFCAGHNIRTLKIVKVIDSLLVLWPTLVPTENIEGSYKLILDAIKEIENIK